MARIPIDLLLSRVGRVVSCAGAEGPLRGRLLGAAQALEDAAVAIDGGLIVELGPSAELEARYAARRQLDLSGKLVTPGFVDPHTHVCYAGDRADEFEQRLQGLTYQELLAQGGGIMRTVRQTRQAPLEQLVAETLPRLERMFAHGTTTVEIKTGYGLTTADELKLLDAIVELQRRHPISIVPTFLGAHTIPAEYAGRGEAYVELLIDEMLPAVARWRDRQALLLPLCCDVFCETGAFSLAQSRRILERAAALGFGLKLHVDEFDSLGGTNLALELRACSADHLVVTPPEQLAALAASQTIAVTLPGTPFGLGQQHYAPARAIVDAGGALALATDCNPGTSVCESLPFIMALACRTMRLTPVEVLHAATINAAYALGIQSWVGSLEVGKRADLLVHDLPDERHLAYRFGANPVSVVIKDGNVLREKEELTW